MSTTQAKDADLACIRAFAEEYQKPPTSWHTIFAHGQAVDRLQFLEKGCVASCLSFPQAPSSSGL